MDTRIVLKIDINPTDTRGLIADLRGTGLHVGNVEWEAYKAMIAEGASMWADAYHSFYMDPKNRESFEKTLKRYIKDMGLEDLAEKEKREHGV